MGSRALSLPGRAQAFTVLQALLQGEEGTRQPGLSDVQGERTEGLPDGAQGLGLRSPWGPGSPDRLWSLTYSAPFGWASLWLTMTPDSLSSLDPQ